MPNFRYGGRPRVDFRQIATNQVVNAASTTSDATLDVSDTDYLALMGRADFNPATPVAADFAITVVPDTLDGAFMSAVCQLTSVPAVAKGVTGTSVHLYEVFDVRALASVKYRIGNANATNNATVNAFASKGLREPTA